jgi:hypothetical protein
VQTYQDFPVGLAWAAHQGVKGRPQYQEFLRRSDGFRKEKRNGRVRTRGVKAEDVLDLAVMAKI